MGKVSAMTADASPTIDDLLMSINAPGVTPGSRKVTIEAVLALAHDYIKVSDVKAHNADGGTFTQDAWRTRVINTEDTDTGSICSVASNQITLAAGTYECNIICPCYKVQMNIARLRNITDGSTELLGQTALTGTVANGTAVFAVVFGRFTLAAQKVLEVQHYCVNTVSDYGFGLAHDIAGVDNVYTIAEFRRVRTQ